MRDNIYIKTTLHTINDERILELEDDGYILKNAQDLLDIIGTYSVRNIILRKENIIPDFFNLKTKVADEILQKASNYGLKIGIIGDFKSIKSKSLRDFIYESNKTKQVIFKESKEEILKIFGKE